MNSVSIQDFGPLGKVSLSLESSMQIFIGPQASGKSTLCKVVFFCRRIRDYVLAYAGDIWNQRVSGDLYVGFLKSLKNPFIGCFGTTKHMDSFLIEYRYSESKYVKIQLDESNFVRFTFSESLWTPIKVLLAQAKSISEQRIGSFAYDYQAQQNYLAMLKQELYKLFEDDAVLLYIPAGRNMLATIPDLILPKEAPEKILEQQDISQTDLFTQSFIRYIKSMQYRFGSKLDEIVENYAKTVSGKLQYRDVELAGKLIKEILKADYVYGRDGDRLYYESSKWIKLMFASSGQQEVLWALNCIFLAILQKEKTFFVFEEPESHILPDSQMEMMKLVALLINSTGSEVFVTTHSPYILTATNLLLYSGQLEQEKKGGIIEQKYRLKANSVDAYLVNTGKKNLTRLLDEDNPLVEAAKIDQISDWINQKMDALLELEISAGGSIEQ